MTKKTAPPTDPMGITEAIIDHGGFLEGLAFLMQFMRSNSSSTLIIRGALGCGKKSLVKAAAESVGHDKIICVYLTPSHHSDDYSAIRFISKKLGLKLRSSLEEMLTIIGERSGGITNNKKIVIVLTNFEEFCRQKQSLLYSLTNLAQHGKKFSLIGLTTSLDCTKGLEKRVRSRLHALFFYLTPPYLNKEDYINFASLLLGKYKITGKLKQQLEYMYTSGNRSIRTLKRYLVSICVWDENGRMSLTMPTEIFDPSNDLRDTTERLHYLTDPQLELFKIAVCYCGANESADFTLSQLESYTKKHEYPSFDTKSQLAITNFALLVKIGFFKASKPQQGIDRTTTFTVNLMPRQLKRILLKNPSLHRLKSDPLWRGIN